MTYRTEDHTWAVCAYGDTPYLEECLRSLKAQKVPSGIMIVTSTPSETIRSLGERYGIPVHEHAKTGSIGGDWNAAYDLASTPLVTLAHQDDVYHPDYTGKLLEYVNRATDPILFFTDYYEIRGEKKAYANRNLRIKKIMLFPLRSRLLWKSRFVRRRILSLGSPICCPSVTYIRPRAGQTVFSTELKVSLDWDQWEKQSRKQGSFVYCPVPLMGHRVHGESETTRMIASHAREKEDLMMFRRFWPESVAGWLVRRYAKSEDQNQVGS